MYYALLGRGAELVESGNNTYGGKYVINPSGGLISKGHPLGASGMKLSCRYVYKIDKIIILQLMEPRACSVR